MKCALRIFAPFLFLIASVAVYAADGDLDLSFGINGLVRPVGDIWPIHSVIQQADGKLVSVGYSGAGQNYSLLLCRYNADGTPDATFGSGGVAVAFAANNTEGFSVIQQLDGKLVAVGETFNRAGVIARFNSDGSLDSTFANGGVLKGAMLPTFIRSVIQQSDGKLLVTGRYFATTRLNNDGSLDASFNNTGVASNPFSGDSNATSLLQQPDGKIVAAGYSHLVTKGYYYDLSTLVRYNPDGSFDSSFGDGGVVIYQSGLTDPNNNYNWIDWSAILSLVQQSDGKLVAAGYDDNPYPSRKGFFVMRFLSNGQLDPTFGATGGLIKVDVSGLIGPPAPGAGTCSCDTLRMIRQPDNKLVIADVRYGLGHFLVVRLDKNGFLDTTFGNGGARPLAIEDIDRSWGITQQFDGNLVVVGGSDSYTNNAWIWSPVMVRLLNSNTVVIDNDGDGIADEADNCPIVSNTNQQDTDSDHIGDVCDSTPDGDTDGDGADNLSDNCPLIANADQKDTDGDGVGDACDSTPNGDTDGDGVDNLSDNCPLTMNADQNDTDGDGMGDACDSLPNNPYQCSKAGFMYAKEHGQKKEYLKVCDGASDHEKDAKHKTKHQRH